MSPYTHSMAVLLSVHPDANARHLESVGDAIADLFKDWPLQRRKELYDILSETVTQGMRFQHLVAAIDEALFINAQDWQNLSH